MANTSKTNKRKPLTFPELDDLEPKVEAKGRRAILRSTEEVNAENEMLENKHSGKQVSQNGSKQGNQQSSSPANQHPGNQELQQTSNPANQEAGIPESLPPGNRNRYPKVTYRLSPDAVDAIEEAKRILKRQYKMKVALEEIAEEAIIAACNDLLENQNTSNLVNKFSGKQKKRGGA